MTTAFNAWVANTIQAMGGSGAKYLRDLQRERALTCDGIRSPLCQGGFQDSDEWFSPDPMRLPLSVVTYSNTIH